MSQFKMVERHRDLLLAELSKAKLESENIFCYLHSKQHISLKWQLSNALGGVKVMVRTDDFEKAKDILTTDESSELMKIEFPAPDITDLCNKCSSENLIFVSYRRYSCALMLLGLPLLFWGGYYKCKSCGHKNK
jgi:hypothetical protein